MSAYKQLNSQDLIVSPFEVNKSFRFEGKAAFTASNVEINRYLGINFDYITSGSLMTGEIPSQQLSQVLVYDSIQQLYYQNYISSSDGFVQPAITSSTLIGANVEGNTLFGKVQSTNFYDYPATSLWPSKTFPTASIYLSDELVYGFIVQQSVINYGSTIVEPTNASGIASNPAYTTNGVGVNAQFSIKIISSQFADIKVLEAGTGFVVGEIITFDNGALGAGSIGGSFTVTTSMLEKQSQIGVVSIPSKLFGDYIQPNSILIEGPTGSIIDDGEGRLLFKSTASDDTFSYMAGNVIYEHGILTIFDAHLPGAAGNPGGGSESDFYGTAIYGTSLYGGTGITYPSQSSFVVDWITGSLVTMSFSSSYTLYETQYKLTVNENEFNYTLNPSSISGSTIPTYFSGSIIDYPNTASNGVPSPNTTGSYFSPYITTVGLYDEDFELLAVGKLAQPLQSSQVTDTTILVNIDR